MPQNAVREARNLLLNFAFYVLRVVKTTVKTQMISNLSRNPLLIFLGTVYSPKLTSAQTANFSAQMRLEFQITKFLLLFDNSTLKLCQSLLEIKLFSLHFSNFVKF